MDYKIEVITLPVADVERAKAFYVDTLGFRLDVDYAPTKAFRVVQVTPPGSAASIQFGVGLTDAQPGAAKSHYLVVADIEEARRELMARGADVGPIVHKADRANWAGLYEHGVDPERASHASFVTIADPDGNTWLVQEVTPG
jgi:catechol 2,3-dioxygenase-like lactoylglutathione lyase family enzyme